MTKEETIKNIKENGISILEMNKIMGNFIKDRDVIKVALEKKDTLYGYLEDESKRDPEILKTALKFANYSSNPIKYAHPEALTEENIFLAIDRNLIDIRDLTPEMLANRNIVIYFMTHTQKSIYQYLPEELRKDPEILRLGITYATIYSDPIRHALPEALTKENLFLAIDKNVIRADNFPQDKLDNAEIVTYYMTQRDSSIYSKISERLRKDPNILTTAITFNKDSWTNPLRYALPEALTKDNILLAIDKNFFYEESFTSEQLEDEDIVTYFISKKGSSLYKKLPESLRRNPEILEVAINTKCNIWNNPVTHALPEALTTRNVILAIDKSIFFESNLTPELLSNKEVIMYFMKKNGSSIYKKLPENLRSDPEVLNVALNSKTDIWTNPIMFAMPSALSKENLFLAIDKRLINSTNIPEGILENKEVVMYFLDKNNSIYSLLSEEFRNDPEILKAALKGDNLFLEVSFALPGALTEENIDRIIELKKSLIEEEAFLSNRYYCINMILCQTNLIDKFAPELQNDPDIVNLAMVQNPKLFEKYGTKHLTEAMLKYIKDNNLTPSSDNIIEIIVSDQEFVKTILPYNAQLYRLLSENDKNNPEYINIIINKNGNNLIYVPNKLISDELINLALSKNYYVSTKHADLIANFLRKKLNSDPEHVYNLFIHTEDKLLELLLIQIISLSKMEIPENIKEKIKSIIDKYLESMKNAGYPDEHIKNFMNNIFNGQTSILNINSINDIYDILYATYLGNLFPDEKSRINRPHRLRPMLFNTVSLDMLTKTNAKQYKELKQILLDMNIDDYTASEITLKMYAVIGYHRSKELLTGKYGPITRDSLTHLFCELDCSEVIFEPDGKKFKPILNEQFINLLFGSSYKVINTPIRNFLNGFSEMEEYVQKEIAKIKANSDLSDSDKENTIQGIKKSFDKYCASIREFLRNISTIFNSWDIIEEQFLSAQHISNIKIKLNIDEINKIVANLKETRREINKLSISTGSKRLKQIPNYEPRDFPLLESDVFDYVGKDTQYTSRPKEAPARAVKLSRMMENQRTKKFPNISLESDGYKIFVYNPQDRNLISAGYRSKCCFRPNGNADNEGKNNSLLTYCCRTEYGGGLEVRDNENNTLMFTPIIRNGNVLMLHSFESMGTTVVEAKIINDLVHEWSKQVLQKSQADEGSEALVAVVATNLHPLLDVIRCKKALSDENKFHVYNPDRKFSGMYTNLSTNEHHVLEFAEGKNTEDIRYDYEVSKSYPYPIQTYSVKNVEVSPEELNLIEQINANKNKIISLANERAKLLKLSKNDSVFRAFELLKAITFIRKENILLIKQLYKINKSKKDILNDYLSALDMINQVCDNLQTTRHTAEHRFTHIFCSYGWYLAITDNNKLYGNYTDGYEEPFFNTVSEIKKRYGLDLEIEINNENNILKNGGLK